jgi:hypothetical protein
MNDGLVSTTAIYKSYFEASKQVRDRFPDALSEQTSGMYYDCVTIAI